MIVFWLCILFACLDAGVASNDYVVVMHPSNRRFIPRSLAQLSSNRSDHQLYAIGQFQWYATTLEDDDIEKLQSHDQVAYVHRDEPIFRIAASMTTVQDQPPSWGLDRIDQEKGVDGRFQFPGSSGQGVNVYLVDTGVNIDHEDLEGRASYGPTFIGDQDDPTDINGHGTFVAGVCCGKTYGVAKKANVISLKTLDKDGSGRLSNVLLALHWIVQQHMATPWVKKIVNLSLATAYHLPTNQAIQEAMHLGLHFSIAAGNQGTDACKFSPASTSGALVVGAIAQDDSIPSFSNSGSCVTIYAPGTGIKSIWNQDNQATKTLSGTSMAAPHLAGVMALLLADDDYTPPALVEKILSSATYVEDRNIRILRLNMPNLMDNNGQSNNISHDHQVATTMSDKQPVGAMRGGFLVLSSANKDIAITLFLFFVAFAHTLYHML